MLDDLSEFDLGGGHVYSINVFGAVTGEFVGASNVMHGFTRSPRGAIFVLNAPGAGTAAGQGTRPSTNNCAGEVAGWYVDGGGLGHGFVWALRGDF